MLCERSEAERRKLVVEVLTFPFLHSRSVALCAKDGTLAADHVGHLAL
jgi:hypothetical protein